MKRFVLPIVFGVGIISLIVVLAMLAVSFQNKANVSDNNQGMPDFNLGAETIPNQKEEIPIQSSSSEEHILPELDKVKPYPGEEDEFKPAKIRPFEVSEKKYNTVNLKDIYDLYGFIKHNVNVEENYKQLVTEIPNLLHNEKYLQDVIDNDNIRLYSKKLNESVTITFLTSLFIPECRVYISQSNGDKSEVFSVCILKNMIYVNSDVFESGEIVIHVTDKDNANNALVLIGEKKGQPSLLSYYKTPMFISLRNVNDISLGNQIYRLVVENSNIVLINDRGEQEVGVIYE